jgi:hypothetical protein
LANKKSAKKWRFSLKTKLNYFKKLTFTLDFEKNAENCRKSQKIVIITPTPDWAIVFFGQFLEKYGSSPEFWTTLFHGKSKELILTKMGLV